MARESKGTRVKTFTVGVPAPTLEREAQKIIVYFRSSESMFYAELPDYLSVAIDRHPEAPKGLFHGWIRSQLADDIEPQFKDACQLFERIQQNAVRKKVIRLFVRANGYQHPADAMGGAFSFGEISFSGPGPALSFSYEVLWQVGDGLYRSHRGDNDLDYMTYVSQTTKPGDHRGGRRETFVIDWTEEREAFVQSINDGLKTLIVRLAQLLSGDAASNVDRLIAGGGGLMLPAPEKEVMS